MDIVLKGHGGEMEVVRGLEGRGLRGGERRRDEPGSPAEVSCETRRLGEASVGCWIQSDGGGDGWSDGEKHEGGVRFAVTP